MSEFFRTTPPGLLTDDDAGFLTQNWNAVPTGDRQFYAAKLNEWQNFREHYPRPYTPSEAAERQRERVRLGEVFDDFDKATQGDDLGALRFADADQAPAIKQGLANRAFVQHMTGLDGDRLERDYELARDALAKKHFGGAGVADDATFHAKAAEWVRNENGKDEVHRSLVEAGRRAAAWEGSGLAESQRPSLKTWHEGQSGKPGYELDFTGEYERMFKAAQAEAKAEFDRLRPYVDAAWTLLNEDDSFVPDEPGALNFEALADRLMEIPYEDRRKVLAMVKARAELLPEKQQEGFWSKADKTFRRTIEGMSASTFMELPRIVGGLGSLGAQDLERQSLYEDIRNLRWLDMEPVIGRNMGESAGLAIVGSLPGMALMGGGGWMLNVPTFASDARQTIRSEMEKKGVSPQISGDLANGFALPAGLAMGVLERVTFGMADSLPGVKQLQAKLLTRLTESGVKRALAIGGAFTLEAVEQNVQEALQDSTPLILVDVAQSLGAPLPEVEAWAPALQTMTDPASWAVSMVFAGIGFGRMPRMEAAAILRERGASDQQIETVLAAPDADTWRAAVLDAVQNPAGAAVAPVEAEVEAGQAVDHEAAGVVGLSRDASGWWVEHKDGRRTRTESAAAAQILIDDLAQVNSQDEADAFVELADSWTAADSRARVSFSGERVTASQDGVFTSRDGEAPRLVPMDAQTAARMSAEMDLMAKAEGGGGPVTRVVAGSNALEFRRRVGEEAQAVVERLDTRQNVGGDVLTMIHERVEATWRAAIEEGKISMAETFRALRRVEAAIGRQILSEDPSEDEVRETVSELAAADVLGRRKDGSRLPAGSITKGLTAAINSAVDPQERATLGKFRAFLRAVRAFWRRVFQTAAAMAKARREGKLKEGDEWGAFVDKLLGIDGQRVHEAAVAKEIEGQTGQAFSLSSATGLERLARQIENRPTTPREKARILNRMAGELAGMARSVQFSDEVSQIVRIGEIRQQAKVKRVELAEKYENEALDTGAGEVLAAAELAKVRGQPFLAWLTDSSKGNQLRSRLMSRTRAAREGRYDPDLHGDFDGAIGLPRWMFNGNQMPDQVAQAAFEDGVLPDASVDTLWQRITDELDQVSKWRSRVRDAESKLMAARKRAGDEARAWEMQEIAKAKTGNETVKTADARRALVILDKMIMALPAEVRPKIGGFTAVAEMKSNDQRFKYFARKVVEIDRVLEHHLRNQYLDEIRELFRTSAPRMAAGEKDKGKIGVDAHAWMQEAERISKLSAADLEAEEAAVEKRLGSPTLSDETVSHYRNLFTFAVDEAGARLALEQHEALLNLFGAIYHRQDGGVDSRGYMIPGPPIRNAGEIFAALEAAQNVVDTGRLDWWQTIVERRERRQGLRTQAVMDVGGPGGLDAVEGQSEERGGVGQKFRNWVESHFSFEGFASSVFGQESATHKWADETSLRSDLRYRDSMRARERALTDFLRTLWPRSSLRQRQKRLEQLATSREVPNAPAGMPRMSEMDAVHFTMLWADQDTASREWLTEWRLGEDAQKVMEAWLSEDAKAIRRWLASGYDAQYDEINIVFRRMYGVNLPRVKNYAPRLVDHGGNQNEMQMDPLQEGRQLMAGFTKRRRIDVKSPPRQVDALTAYWQNAHAVEYWKAWAESTSELRAVFSHYSTHAAVKSRWGNDTATALNEWIGVLERNGVQNANGQGLIRRWSSAMADFALVGKLGVLAKQMVAGYASASQIGIPEFLRSLQRIATGESAISLREMYQRDTIQRRLPTAGQEVRVAVRGRGLTPIEARLDRFLGLVGTDINALDNAHVWLRERIGATDAVFTTLSAAAAYDAAYRDGVAAGMDDAAARRLAEAQTEKVVADSAQPETVRDKSLGELRGGAYGRILMPFQSANRQALGMTLLALKQGRTREAAQMAVIHWMATGIVAQTIGNVIRSLASGDDVEDVWEWEDYARAIVVGPLTGARYLGMGIEAAAPFIGGFERRQAAVPLSEGLRLLRLAFRGEWDFKSLTDTLGGVGLLVGGRAGWAAIAANLLKQGAGVGDTLTWSEEEADAKQSKRDRETIREEEKQNPEPEKPEAQIEAEKARRRARERERAAAIRARQGE